MPLYGLTETDRRNVRDALRRIQGGGTSQRPVARRRRGPRGGGGSSLRYAYVTSAVTAAAGTTPGAGTVQPKKVVDGEIVDDGPTVDVVNLHPIAFAVGDRGYIDGGKSPPECVVFTCVPAA